MKKKEWERLITSSVVKPLEKTGFSVEFVKTGITYISPILEETTCFMSVIYVYKNKVNPEMNTFKMSCYILKI